ncbi:MFS transporter [Streptomyces sp. NPDC089919]|uniref:MFS transporter n=1 Tax=Streptomyces sp. NPDC089919 TaxID=3155188 RepID=UPI00342D3069
MRGSAGFGRYLATAVGARFAGEGVGLALVLLAVQRTGEAALGAFVLTAWTAPHALAAPAAGTLAARTRRPRVFYAGALAGFGTAVAALALLVGRAPVAVVVPVALAGGCCGPVVTGGLSSLVARLVPEGPARDRAYAWDAVTYNAASVSAPGAVGLLASLGWGGAAMGVLAGSAALAAVGAGFLPYGRPGAAGTPAAAPARAGVSTGLTALWRVPELRAITTATTVGFLGIGALTTTAVLLAGHLGGTGSGGVLMTAFALGALAGALGLTRLARPAGTLAEAALLGTGLALAAAVWAPSLPVAAGLFAVAGVCEGPLLTATLRIRADHAPAGAREQVFTLGAGLKMTAGAAGAATAGLAAALPPGLLLGGIAALQLTGAALHRLLRPEPAPQPAGPPAPTAAPTALTSPPDGSK